MFRLLLTACCMLIVCLDGVLEHLEAARPNVLLIVSEDNGPELGCYGDKYARTPHLDQLAHDGVRFDRAFVPYSVCSPSRACFLTGLHSHENGQIGLATHKFAMYQPDTTNIVTLLQQQGYQTGLIGKLHVNPEAAFPFDFRAIPDANFRRRKDVGEYVQHAQSFWAKAEEKKNPWFLSVNFPDAHLPFLRQVHGKPEKVQTGDDVTMLPWIGANSPRLREVMADYYNCMARLDDWIGQLLRALHETGTAENTLVIYIGDHGAQFPRGKGTVYEGGLRVPMILRWPGNVQSRSVRQQLVSTLDILPTVLTAVGTSVPTELTGRPLQPLFDDKNDVEWREYIFAMTTGSFPRNCFVQHSVRGTRFKLISNPRPQTENLIAGSYLNQKHPHFVVSGVQPEERSAVDASVERAYAAWERPPHYELYDLTNDPYEWTNLADDPQFNGELERLIMVLDNFQVRTRDPLRDPQNLDAFVTEQLGNRDFKYRRQPDFRWNYIDDFHAWRERQ